MTAGIGDGPVPGVVWVAAVSDGERHATDRWAVLRAMAAGLGTDQVAALLGIAPGAVRAHLRVAMAELGARSKLEAILLALRRGLIELPD